MRNKKGLMMGAMLIIIAFVCVCIILAQFFPYKDTYKDKENEELCKKIGMEFLKTEETGFFSSDAVVCYNKTTGEIKRI